MRVLLDTSYLYDLMSAPKELAAAERLLLSSADAEFCVSAASIWEMKLKFNARHASGERKSGFDPQEVLAVLAEEDIEFLPISMEQAAAPLRHPIAHRDPFDEMLLVQAQEEGLKLLTIDRRLADHPLAIAP